MKISKKSLISFMIMCIMIMHLLPLTVFAEDTRIEITELVATSNISSVAVYGAEIKAPTFTVTKGSPGYFNTNMGNWWKKDGDTWVKITNGSFTSGTWRYATQLRIDGNGALTHKLAQNLTVKVNGQNWTVFGNTAVGDTFSFNNARSMEITISAGSSLVFNKLSNWNIPNNYVGTPITSFSVASGADGGTKPYTFSKTSGPNWINVSSTGNVSGTPTATGNNASLVVKVKDKVGNNKEITINVGKTSLSNNNKTEISSLIATSNTNNIAVYGGAIQDPTFTVTTGAPAFFNTTMGNWWKKNGDTWEKVTSGTFSTGTWRYSTQIRIDGDAGLTHKFAQKPTVRVDGQDWTVFGNTSVGDVFSFSNVRSPEIEISENAVTYTVSFNTNGGGGYPVQIVEAGKCAYRPVNPSKRGCVFDGWYTSNAYTQLFNFSTPITKNTVIYAKWIELDPTYINEIRITSSTTFVEPGTLPTYTATCETEHLSIEKYGQNTTWSVNPSSNPNGWQGLSSLYAYSNGYHYALRIRVILGTGYDFYDDVRIYFNGKDITEKDLTYFNNGFSWGGYLYIDLGRAAKRLNVSFDLDGGMMQADTNQIITEGETVPTPDEPSRGENYLFCGWYTDNTYTNLFDFDIPITEDTTICAKWERLYKVTFNANGHGTNPSYQYVRKGMMPQNPDLTYVEGYRVIGWYLEPECENEYIGAPITEDITLYACWEAAIFPDVGKSDWFYEYVKYVKDNGLMGGYTSGEFAGYFGPEDPITRGQIVTILYRREGQPVVTGSLNFADKNDSTLWSSDYYNNAILWASQNGIVTGYKNGADAGKFLPDKSITRAEFAIILQRYAKLKGMSINDSASLTGFYDYDQVEDWEKAGLAWAVAKGIISGDMATTPPSLKPHGNATRAEAATMITRFCKNV